MRRFISRMLMAIVLTGSCFAPGIAAAQQTPAPAEQPATREEILQLLEALRWKRQLAQYFDVIKTRYRQGIMEKVKKSFPDGITEEQQGTLAKMVDDLFGIINVDEMLELLVPIYQKHLTSEDVRIVLAFYRSPTGRKMLDKQPEMMAEGAAVGEEYMRRKQPELERLTKQRMEEFIQQATEKKSEPKSEPKKD